METLVIKAGPDGRYPLLSTLVVYAPCWTFVDFCKFAGVLRHHHASLRTVRVGAMVWVDREAAVEILKDVTKDNGTLAFEVGNLNLPTNFGVMELPEVCTVGMEMRNPPYGA